MIVQLEYTLPNGRPNRVPQWCVREGGDLLLTTSRSGGRAAALRARPEVTVVAPGGHRARGRAVVEETGGDRLHRRLAAEHGAPAGIGTSGSAAPRLVVRVMGIVASDLEYFYS